MTMDQMKSIMTNQSTFDENLELISGVNKLVVNQGDVIIFKFKTDKDGEPYLPISTLDSIYKNIIKYFPGITCLLIPDQIYIDSLIKQGKFIQIE